MDIDLLLAPYGNKSGIANQPNPSQAKILAWKDKVVSNWKLGIKTEGIPILWIRGGVGSGKSRGILAAVDELQIEIPNLRVLWGRKDFKDIKLSIMDKYFEIMPPELIVNKSEAYHWYDVQQNGGTTSRIYFGELKDLSGLGSQEFGVIAVTEVPEITEQCYRTLKRRCRQENVPNMIILEGEAPNEGHW